MINNFNNNFRFAFSKVPEAATAAEIIKTIDEQIGLGDPRFLHPGINVQRVESIFFPDRTTELIDALGSAPPLVSHILFGEYGYTDHSHIYAWAVKKYLGNYKPVDYFEKYMNDEPTGFYESLSKLSDSLFFENYKGVLAFLIVATIIAIIIAAASYSLSIQKPETEKLSTYECGFEPYEDARHKFDIKFCLIAILFIVFDIEVVYLIPWSIELSKLDILGFWAMVEFLFELGIGFIYIWLTNSLEWDIR